eukprot:GHRQ01008424.1.p2 GENE.GHRQ01008424.1~~GHRQ01008424.1.p2  ORF type:complete len:176 (+),score=15.29 GHRQ01008424.1:119-646(+)
MARVLVVHVRISGGAWAYAWCIVGVCERRVCMACVCMAGRRVCMCVCGACELMGAYKRQWQVCQRLQSEVHHDFWGVLRPLRVFLNVGHGEKQAAQPSMAMFIEGGARWPEHDAAAAAVLMQVTTTELPRQPRCLLLPRCCCAHNELWCLTAGICLTRRHPEGCCSCWCPSAAGD